MTLEEFDSLPLETKKELMIHWWHYYGKCPYLMSELETFIELLNKDIDKVIEFVVADIVFDYGSVSLLYAIRANKVEELINSLPNIEELQLEERTAYEEVKVGFINEIVSSSGLDFSKTRK